MQSDSDPQGGSHIFESDPTHRDDPGHVDAWHESALDLIAGTLAPHVAERLEAHLAACPECRETLADQRSIASILNSIAEAAVPAELDDSVLAGLAALAQPSPVAAARATSSRIGTEGGALRSLRRFLVPRVWLPAAAMALVAGVAISSYYQVGIGSNGDADRLAAESQQKDVSAASPEAASADDAATQAAESAAGGQTTLAGAPPTTASAASGPMYAAGVLSQRTDELLRDLAASDTEGPPVLLLTVTGGIGAGDPSGSTAAVESLTGLEPLPRDAWIAGLPTFAALILADDAGALATDLAVFASELAARVASHADYSSEAPAPLADMLGWGASSLLLLTPQDAGATSTTTTVSAPTDSVEDRPATAEPATPRRTWLAEAHVPLRAGAGERLAIVVIVLGPAVAQ